MKENVKERHVLHFSIWALGLSVGRTELTGDFGCDAAVIRSLLHITDSRACVCAHVDG